MSPPIGVVHAQHRVRGCDTANQSRGQSGRQSPARRRTRVGFRSECSRMPDGIGPQRAANGARLRAIGRRHRPKRTSNRPQPTNKRGCRPLVPSSPPPLCLARSGVAVEARAPRHRRAQAVGCARNVAGETRHRAFVDATASRTGDWLAVLRRRRRRGRIIEQVSHRATTSIDATTPALRVVAGRRASCEMLPDVKLLPSFLLYAF